MVRLHHLENMLPTLAVQLVFMHLVDLEIGSEGKNPVGTGVSPSSESLVLEENCRVSTCTLVPQDMAQARTCSLVALVAGRVRNDRVRKGSLVALVAGRVRNDRDEARALAPLIENVLKDKRCVSELETLLKKSVLDLEKILEQ